MGDFLTVAGTLLAVVAVLALCWFSTRKLAAFGRFQANGKMLCLMDQVGLGQDKGIALVRLGERYYLVGVASSQVSLLAELDEETVEAAKESAPQTMNPGNAVDFRQLMEKIKLRKK